MSAPEVYAFDHPHDAPPRTLKDLLGGKGAGLAELTSVLKMPVPPGFTIAVPVCRAYRAGGWPDGLTEAIAQHWPRAARAESSDTKADLFLQ